MFDRTKYKRIALTQLKNQWKLSVFTTVLSAALLLLISLPGVFASLAEYLPFLENHFHISKISPLEHADLLTVFMGFILYSGHTFAALELAKENQNISLEQYFQGLTKWLKALQGGFWIFLNVFLWSLLFFIPGIVKAVAYSQTFFLLCEYPKLGTRRAMKISRLMTNGYKGDLFVMMLSFSGWFILSCITCGIGLLWLFPYANQAFTNAYLELKSTALKSGCILEEDLTGEKNVR